MIDAVDKEILMITRSKFSVPLKVSAAMAAEVAGACILTEVQDLLIEQK